MSEVIGRWVIVTQDAMPADVRNSERWKSLLPLAAGTGRDREQARLDIILSWMWGTVLPSLQSLADQRGFGAQWQQMTTERTAESEAARAAHRAARAAHRVARAAEAAVEVAWEATGAAEAAGKAAEAAEAEARGATTWAAGKAAEVVVAAARATAARAEAWADFDPCGLLERLIKIDSNNAQENI
jgi:hypothetical protein